MGATQPTVTGNLGKTPLLHVLVSLLEKGSSGTLVVETAESVRSALYVDRGVPTKMRLGEPQARLGEILLQLGYLKEPLVLSTYEQAAKDGCLHGKILLNEGLLDEETLRMALRSQLVQKLLIVAALPQSTVFGFYEGTDYLAKWRSGPTPVSPLAAAWALAQYRTDPKTVAVMVGRIAEHPLRLHGKSVTTGFGFERHQQAILDVLRAKPQKLDAMERLHMVSREQLERMAYVLTLTRHLDFGRDLHPLGIGAVAEKDEPLLDSRESLRPSRPVILEACGDKAGVPGPARLPKTPQEANVASPSRPEAPPLTNAPDPPSKPIPSSPRFEERRAQFEKMSKALEDRDHFALFGVSRDSSPAHIQETFLKLAKLYHPDRLPNDLADLRPLATRIFARLSEALPILTDPSKRQSYLQALERGPDEGEEEKVRRVLRAAASFNRAEVLLKKRMLAAAELEAGRALEEDPEQPDYRALFAWIQASKPESQARLPEFLKQISDAIAANGDSEKNRYYRVQILKRLDKVEEAVADCRVIVERNPHHVDALREIRIWEMRRAPHKGTPPHKPATPDKPARGKPGSEPRNKPPSDHRLLGRLFKR